MKVLAIGLLLVFHLFVAEFFITFAVAEEVFTDNLRDPNIINVIVEYTSQDGKNVAKREALELSYESTRFNLLGMKIAAKSLKLLQDDEGIQRVDLDSEVDAILSFVDEDGEEDEEETDINLRYRRNLIEQVPWGIRAIQADQVEPGPFASEVKVCIVDSGYGFHPDLPGRDAVTGTHSSKYSSSAGNRWDHDGRKHGTGSAGVIAAIDNEIGVVGVLQNVNPNSFTLHISKGLDDHGRGSVLGVIEAIEGCIDAGSNVISMSLRVGRGFVRSFDSVLRSAYLDHDILLVAASGNDGNTTLSFPASYGSVMSVSAVRRSSSGYIVAHFSNFNDQVEITAPGVRIKTTSSRNKYKLRSGTSLSTPYVAGVAALLRSYGRCSAEQVRRILLATAIDIGKSGCDAKAGHGLVQAKSAVDMLRKHGCKAADRLDLLDAKGMNDGTFCKPTRNEEEQVIRINAGSSHDYVDPEGNIWSADKYYDTGRTYFTTANISNTDKPELYRSERYSPRMAYEIPVGKGIFLVSLCFSEIFAGAFGVGKRVFRVLVEGHIHFSEIDIYKESGKRNKAYVTSERGVVVRDGLLSIEFIGIRENAKISAIEIRKVG